MWSPEQIREYLLSKYRELYKDTAAYRQELEIKNSEARRNGVSFKERKALMDKIEIGAKVALAYRHAGENIPNYSFEDLVSPENLPFIEQYGMEKFLKLEVVDNQFLFYLRKVI